MPIQKGPANLGTGVIDATELASASVTPAKLSTGGPTWDTSGNVGVGVTLSAWYPTYRALSLGYSSNGMFSGGTTQLGLTQNAYLDSGINWIYTTTNPASQYTQTSGAHTWRSAASGTAGNAISFTQLLAVEKDKSLALQGATSQTGVGISFPATQSASSDANTLDDYEEGTFTPTLRASGYSFTTSAQNGYYVKVGKLVTCRIYISKTGVSGSGTSAGTFDLPFQAAADNIWAGGSITPDTGSSWFTAPAYVRVGNSASRGEIATGFSGNNGVYSFNWATSPNMELEISCSYFTS
jgi:predicted RecA/RadA family phage recombinase